MHSIKLALLHQGVAAIDRVIRGNKRLQPHRLSIDLMPAPIARRSVFCAYYRSGFIHINVKACAAPAPAAMCRQWSTPGYKIDRTPYGVVLHELGHHVDLVFRTPSRRRIFKLACRGTRISSYETVDNAELFAETFRLFASNPDLLKHGAPNRYDYMIQLGLKPISEQNFATVLNQFGAPPRVLAAATKWAGL